MRNTISIVIPTLRYTELLDEAIASCLRTPRTDLAVHVNVNSDQPELFPSKFRRDRRVSWARTPHFFDQPCLSLNHAVRQSTGKWVLVLSDDDLLMDDFLRGVDIAALDASALVAMRAILIDENGARIGVQEPWEDEIFEASALLSRALDGCVRHHLSAFVFSRELFESVGGFAFTGYPNGFYVDTVLQLKLLANCTHVVSSNALGVARRVHSNQLSARFYLDARDVNHYFTIIADHLWADPGFRKRVQHRFRSRRRLATALRGQRVIIELSKLSRGMYSDSAPSLIRFLFSVMAWDLIWWKKMMVVLLLMAHPLRRAVPRSLRWKLRRLFSKP